jgi:hypothetical protein
MTLVYDNKKATKDGLGIIPYPRLSRSGFYNRTLFLSSIGTDIINLNSSGKFDLLY